MNLATAISRSKNKILILTFLLTTNTFMYTANAQFIPSEWINISNQAGDDMYPDIFKAKNGNLHCVWTLVHNNNHREIFYSKSIDNGETWSPPENITNNDTFSFYFPHIVADSQNHLYVTADKVGTVLITNDGSGWSEITHLSNSGQHNKIYIDKNDRVYAFWSGGLQFRYRFFDNGIWSETFQPVETPDTAFIFNGCVDSENNLHLIGFYNNKPAYYKYTAQTDTWRSPHNFTEYFSYADQDITVDNNNNPYVVFRVRTNSQPPYHDGTVFYPSNGISFSPPETIVEDPVRQKIVWYNNQIYIVDKEKYGDDYKIVLYTKDKDNIWWGTVISYISPFCTIIKVLIIDNQLCILYTGEFDGIQDEVYLQKLNIFQSSVSELSESPLILYQNYPNPLKEQTTFKYATSIKGHCRLQILDLHGRILAVPLNKEQIPGTYTLQWNACDASGNRLPAGTYYYRFTIDNLYTMTKSLIINE